MLSDRPRLKRLLASTVKPVQILYAGKAHPADQPGKALLHEIVELAREEPRVAFLEDYDIEIAQALVAGCDVWLNLPRRPLEASGTSGMKATFNGVLQLSVLDGWWAEAYDGTNGWGIEGDPTMDVGDQDDRDAASLFGLLEEQVVPL